jgi:polyisoprenoid-binding protein YceI
MKTIFSQITITALAAMLLLVSTAGFKAFSQAKSEISGNAKITVEGTSNIHDWAIHSEKGVVNIVLNENMSAIAMLNFTVPVESLKSESKAMDKNTYKTLKTGKYASISFSASNVAVKQLSGNSYNLTSNGKLTISGVTKPVVLLAKAVVNNDNSITYTGTCLLKMSDYNIEPPSLMLGAIKTGDGIKVTYSVHIQGKNYISQLTKN